MSFYGYHGVHEHERIRGQRYLVDIEVGTDTTIPAKSDDLLDTVNYSKLFDIVKNIVEGPSHNLIESLASDIASAVLSIKNVSSITVRVKKLEPPIANAILDYASVEITRYNQP